MKVGASTEDAFESVMSPTGLWVNLVSACSVTPEMSFIHEGQHKPVKNRTQHLTFHTSIRNLTVVCWTPHPVSAAYLRPRYMGKAII